MSRTLYQTNMPHKLALIQVINTIVLILTLEVNKWDLIFDFTKDDNKRNFEFLDPSEFKIIIKQLDDFEQKAVQVFDIPERYGGTIADDANFQDHGKDESDMMAFSIDTSMKDAAKKVEE